MYKEIPAVLKLRLIAHGALIAPLDIKVILVY